MAESTAFPTSVHSLTINKIASNGVEEPLVAEQPASPPPPPPATIASPAAKTLVDDKNIVRRKLTGYVGFANLPNQWHRKSVRKGFNFNVMVVGRFSDRKFARESFADRE